jgi:hypothetical protein
MSNPKIEKVETIDNTPSVSSYNYGEYDQGTEWTNWDIYKLTDAAGNITHFKIGRVFGSYGGQIESTGPVLCTPVTRTITAWE